MSLLESHTKFSIKNPRGTRIFEEREFFNWTNNNFYRTSYNDMGHIEAKKPAQRKSHSIPGYAGYRPNIKAQGHIGKTITEQSRDVFHDELDRPINDFSTTGFNNTLIPKKDNTREARSRRYGTETWHFPHPVHHHDDYRKTTTRLNYINPSGKSKPNFVSRDSAAMFENSPNLKFKAVMGQSGFGADTHFKKEALNNLSSGYTENRQHWDGSGWGTEANQHTDQIRTTYRNGFNQPKPFHKTELRNNHGRFNAKQAVFDIQDKYTNKAAKLPFH
jgi:hypothetical protein